MQWSKTDSSWTSRVTFPETSLIPAQGHDSALPFLPLVLDTQHGLQATQLQTVFSKAPVSITLPVRAVLEGDLGKSAYQPRPVCSPSDSGTTHVARVAGLTLRAGLSSCD